MYQGSDDRQDEIKEGKFEIHVPNILKILADQLYSSSDMVVREIIQNANDSCVIRKANDIGYSESKICISYNKEERFISFTDNGTGMTEEELCKYLSVIGKSFTDEQREKLNSMSLKEARLLIGQFGIGLLSAFSVASKVEVSTRSYKKDSVGLKWTCEGNINYRIDKTPIDKYGTCITLYLLDKSHKLCDLNILRAAIKKYADFLSVPIYVGEDQVNVCMPPWEVSAGSDVYEKYIRARYNQKALFTFSFAIDEVGINATGLFFVPDPNNLSTLLIDRDRSIYGEIDIYVARMFIETNREKLIPNWGKFIKGVINITSSSLDINLSRSELIRNEKYEQLARIIEKVILHELYRLKNINSSILQTIVSNYNNLIKSSCLEYPSFYELVSDYVVFKTNRGEMCMPSYLKVINKIVYCFTNHNFCTQATTLFKDKLVIDATLKIDYKFLQEYVQNRSLSLIEVDTSSENTFKLPVDEELEEWNKFEGELSRKLQVTVRAVIFEPKNLPALFVKESVKERKVRQENLWESIDDALVSQQSDIEFLVSNIFEDLNEILTENHKPSQRILHINTSNEIVCKLFDMQRGELFDYLIKNIFNNAVILSQDYISSEEPKFICEANIRFVSFILDKLESSTAITQANYYRKNPHSIKSELNSFRSCFFSFDYKNEENFILLEKIQSVLCREKIGIKVIAPVKEMGTLDIRSDIYEQIKKVHFCIADISSNNPNVFIEIGIARGMGKPIILLKSKESTCETPFNIYGDYRIEYEVSKRNGKVRFIWLEEELIKSISTVFEMIPFLQKVRLWE